MNLSDLAPPARLYLLGYCRNDRERAKALAEVVFQGQNLRTVAKAYGLDPRTLRRQRDAFRRKFRTMMRSAKVSVFDLVARSEQG